MTEQLPIGKKIYFASDFHFGVPTYASSLERERLVVQWLCDIERDAQEIYLVGDIFDFWFEYKCAIPKGFTRFQGKIAALTDAGIPVYFFSGNHDMWMFDYFERELGVKVIHQPVVKQWNEKRFYIGHGDGLGPGDYGYKFIKKIFRARWSNWLFARLHPNFGVGLALYLSRRSRAAGGHKDEVFLGKENEWLYLYCKEELKKEPAINYFIFGHRHLPMRLTVSETSEYINLGEWLSQRTFLEFDGVKCTLKKYPSLKL